MGRPEVRLRPRRLELASAELRPRGYSVTEQKDPASPERPRYLLAGTTPRWLDLEGYHTRFGEVVELLRRVDDRYVIMNAGDEMRLRFPEAPPLAPGLVRDFVVVADGWVKDGDYNTTFSRTVLPLPEPRGHGATTGRRARSKTIPSIARTRRTSPTTTRATCRPSGCATLFAVTIEQAGTHETLPSPPPRPGLRGPPGHAPGPAPRPRSPTAATGGSDPLKQYGFRLTESSKAAGLDFVHEAPTLDPKLAHIMPQVASMGAAVSVVDFDADGLPTST